MAEPFTKVMRKKTLTIHSISDALINAKLGIALSNTRVWSEGLLCFYEIFKFLEDAMDRLGHTCLGELDIPGMRRTAAFERDLSYYLGENWKDSYEMKSSVKEYISYLELLEIKDHRLLMAYVYHLYMGLLSGGQILLKKRNFFRKLTFNSNEIDERGSAVLSVENTRKIKSEMKSKMNDIAGQLDEPTRQALITESNTLFEMNNKMVATIETYDIFFRKWLINLSIITCILACLYVILVNNNS